MVFFFRTDIIHQFFGFPSFIVEFLEFIFFFLNVKGQLKQEPDFLSEGTRLVLFPRYVISCMNLFELEACKMHKPTLLFVTNSMHL